MKSFTIAGVPEHFNFPWELAIEEGAFFREGIDLNWEDVPEGTGRMANMLANGEVDMAVILTEGIVRSILSGNPCSIVQEYIATPLLWGIHVAEKSSFEQVVDLENKVVAISRFGSGSHLMAFVWARSMGWDTTELKFKVVHNLEGAIEALTTGKADCFLWEHFTTKPLVDSGIFRRLDDCPTPWPCFVLAAPSDRLSADSDTYRKIVNIINRYTTDFSRIPSIDRTLANRYEQKLEDIQEWLKITSWSQQSVSDQVIENVQDTLLDLKLIDKKNPPSNFLTSL